MFCKATYSAFDNDLHCVSLLRIWLINPWQITVYKSVKGIFAVVERKEKVRVGEGTETVGCLPLPAQAALPSMSLLPMFGGDMWALLAEELCLRIALSDLKCEIKVLICSINLLPSQEGKWPSNIRLQGKSFRFYYYWLIWMLSPENPCKKFLS